MAESISKSIQAAAAAAEQVKAVRDDLSSRRSKLGAQIAALRERNTFLSGLPLNLRDGRDFVKECVDIRGREFLARANLRQLIESFAKPQRGWAGGVAGRSTRPLALDDVLAVREEGVASLGNSTPNFFVGGGSIDSLKVDADALCFFFGDAIKAKLEAHFDDWYPDYTKDINAGRRRSQFHAHYEKATPEELASSIDDRLAEIRSNDERIERLEQEIYELDEAAASLGGLTEQSAGNDA
jgi:cell division protein FtsB